MLERLLKPLARRWPWVATALAVQRRFGEVRGGFLAAAITLTLFLSLFPLLLVGIAVLGFFAENDGDLAQQIVESLGLTGQYAQTVTGALEHASETKQAASIVGLVGMLWSGLGVVGAIEYALDATWQQTGRSIKDKLRAVGWCVGGLIVLGSSVALTAGVQMLFGGGVVSAVSLPVALAVDFVFWMWTFLVLSFDRVQWKAYVPGAVVGAIGLEAIKQVTAILPQLFEGSSVLYGSIGAVFGLLAVIALFGRLTIYASLLNVVRWEEDNGTVTIDVEVPRIPGEAPLEATRGGAAAPPIPGRS